MKTFEDSYTQVYMDSMYPQPEPIQLAAGPSATMSDAPSPAAGSMSAIPQTGFEKILEQTGLTLEQVGMELDKLGKVSIGGFEIGIRDFLPFVGSSEKEIDPATGKETVKQVGTPQALQKLGTGVGPMLDRVSRGTGFARQLDQDAKLAMFDLPTVGAAIKPAAKLGKTAVNATKELPVGLSIKPVGQIPTGAPAPNVVSTRLPTAKKATEDPIANKLVIDLPTMKADPNAFTENINLIREYPNFVSNAANTDQAAEDFIGQVKDNLLWLYDQVPDQTRNRSRLWYDGARNIVDQWGGEFGKPDQAISGVLAVLSPQKDWFMNVSLGNRVLDIALNKNSFGWDSAMDDTAGRIWAKEKYAPVLNLVRGKSYNELTSPAEKALWLRTYDETFNDRAHQIVTPEGTFAGVRLKMDGTPFGTGWGSLNEIGKAVAILENPSLENISLMLGQQHKVRNFYNNIYAPNDQAGHVTIDTHAVAAGLLRPLSGNSREVAHNFGSNIKGERGPVNSSISGAQGTYGLYAEAYRRAAADRGVLPREMQSITWEAVRGLFPDRWKTEKNSQLIDNIWVEYRKGKISLEEARNEVIRSAGGINAPEWESAGLRGGAAGQSENAVDQGQLSGSSLSGRSAERSRRNKSAAGNSTSVIGGQAAPAMGAE
jgi:hypothetical protein